MIKIWCIFFWIILLVCVLKLTKPVILTLVKCRGHIFLLDGAWWQTIKLTFSLCGHLPVLSSVFVIL